MNVTIIVTSVKVYQIFNGERILKYGTMADVIKFAKDLWTNTSMKAWFDDKFDIEEDYYAFVDADPAKALRIVGLTYHEICEVPIEDFTK
jgi:hypothetical protein